MPESCRQPYAAIALNVPVGNIFHYRIPAPLASALKRGARVKAPFGRREMTGYCVGFDETPSVEESRIKDLIALVDREPLLDDRMLELTRWMAGYYACTWGEALEAVLPGAVRKRTAAATMILVSAKHDADTLRTAADDCETRAPRQARVLRALADTDGDVAARDLLLLAEADYGVLRALERDGWLSQRKEKVADDPTLQFHAAHADPPAPTPEQQAAIDAIGQTLDAETFKVMLLHGVTGSGKTEVYLRALERVVAEGRQGIVLVPEIALTPQTVLRFKSRFERVCVLHSHLSERGRREQWRAIREGRADVVIGARSAVFAPAPRLGLVIVDEEHEPSFKQQNVPRYHGRDVAIWRARQEGAVVLLGSATPSLESYQNALAGKYDHLKLARRVSDRPLPPVQICDLAAAPKRRGKTPLISPRLVQAVEETLRKDEQVILFLNRRGFHTHIACPSCGITLSCKHCDVSLTFHRASRRARCHYCGFDMPAPDKCPSCDNRIHYHGTGTQRVEDVIAALFGEEKVARMDSDTMRGYGKYEETLSDFRDGRKQILLGTQMVAKGLDFPNVTLVGVINADVSLNMPDFRAAERTFQLLTQVAGRAGRGERGGRVIVQTFSPDHPCVQFARGHDYTGFARMELAERKAFSYPPFGRLARIVAEGAKKPDVMARLQGIVEAVHAATTDLAVEVQGPVDAPIGRVKGKYRAHAIVRAGRVSDRQRAMAAVERGRTKGVQVLVDIDPVTFL